MYVTTAEEERRIDDVLVRMQYPDQTWVAELQEWFGDQWEQYYKAHPLSEKGITVVTMVLRRKLNADEDFLAAWAVEARKQRRDNWKRAHGPNEALRKDNDMLRARVAELEQIAYRQ